MNKENYNSLKRELNIILRAAKDFGLVVNGQFLSQVNDLYCKAADLIDENGFDRFVTNDQFDFDRHSLYWNDGHGYEIKASGEFNDNHFMRHVNGEYVDIEEYQVKWGEDYQLVYDDIDTNGQRVGFLVKTEK